jgi:hypothetical protein
MAVRAKSADGKSALITMFAQTRKVSFDQTFLKVCAGGGREALLVLRRARNQSSAFLF